MERNHDEVPVSITDVPSDPDRGVCVEDERQQDNVSDRDDGAGQKDHQTNKHLSKKTPDHLKHKLFTHYLEYRNRYAPSQTSE